MDKLMAEIKNLRQRQDEDFELVMQALADQRDSVTGVAKAVAELAAAQAATQTTMSSYRESNSKLLDRIQTALLTNGQETRLRFESLEERVSALEAREPPAA